MHGFTGDVYWVWEHVHAFTRHVSHHSTIDEGALCKAIVFSGLALRESAGGDGRKDIVVDKLHDDRSDNTVHEVNLAVCLGCGNDNMRVSGGSLLMQKCSQDHVEVEDDVTQGCRGCWGENFRSGNDNIGFLFAFLLAHGHAGSHLAAAVISNLSTDLSKVEWAEEV